MSALHNKACDFSRGLFTRQFNADRLANGMSPGYDANCHEEQLGRLEEGALIAWRNRR